VLSSQRFSDIINNPASPAAAAAAAMLVLLLPVTLKDALYMTDALHVKTKVLTTP